MYTYMAYKPIDITRKKGTTLQHRWKTWSFMAKKKSLKTSFWRFCPKFMNSIASSLLLTYHENPWRKNTRNCLPPSVKSCLVHEQCVLEVKTWLVVSTPLKYISQLGWLSPIYGKIKMFQTTNQKRFFPGWTSLTSKKIDRLLAKSPSCCLNEILNNTIFPSKIREFGLQP